MAKLNPTTITVRLDSETAGIMKSNTEWSIMRVAADVVLILAIVGAATLLLLTSCDAEPLQWQPDIELFPCDDDRDCLDDEELCLDALGECRPLCYGQDDCPGGHCGEPVGEEMGRRVCWYD